MLRAERLVEEVQYARSCGVTASQERDSGRVAAAVSDADGLEGLRGVCGAPDRSAAGTVAGAAEGSKLQLCGMLRRTGGGRSGHGQARTDLEQRVRDRAASVVAVW